MKKLLFLFIIIAAFKPGPLSGQQVRLVGTTREMIAGPANASQQKKWIDTLKQWRAAEREKLKYNDKEYRRPQFGWVKTCFIYAQIMAHDRYLYDPEKGN